VIFIIVLQQLEGNLIYPRVVGKSVGLPGLLVLAAVTVGSSIGGILGMLLAVPVCSVIFTVCAQAVEARIAQKDTATAETVVPEPLTPTTEEAAVMLLPVTDTAPAAQPRKKSKKKKK